MVLGTEEEPLNCRMRLLAALSRPSNGRHPAGSGAMQSDKGLTVHANKAVPVSKCSLADHMG